MIWIVFALMTAIVMVGLLWPVVRGRRAQFAAADRNAYDRAVFRDQLAELERDVERQTIAPAEAEAARNEISRRLIAASAEAPARKAANLQVAALAAALLIPAVALPLYLKTGSPDLPDVPLAQRLANAEKNGDYEALILKVEQHLEKVPDDLKGWQILAPAYRRASRWADAAEASRNIIRLSPPNANDLADLGETLAFAGQGEVTAEAEDAFRKALALDPKLPKARFYAALAMKQQGKSAEARAAFEAFLADTPADAPWRDMLLAEMKDVSAQPPAIDQQTMQDAAGMKPEDQQAMIRGMVDGLEKKLEADGSDLQGWLRLIRARAVLGDRDKAKAAYDSAKSKFKDNPDAVAQLDGLAKEINIP